MRNLLSFVLGVISRLFYLLLRLILLLDRTICRIYDLPVWSRFAGVLRQAGRRRSVCALSVFGLLFLLPALLLTRPGTLLARGRSAARCYRGQRNAAERSKRG